MTNLVSTSSIDTNHDNNNHVVISIDVIHNNLWDQFHPKSFNNILVDKHIKSCFNVCTNNTIL